MEKLFTQVLFIGPHYRLRGGMASVLKVYSQSFKPFNFIAAYNYSNPLAGLLYFIWAAIRLCAVLLTNRKIRIVHLQSASRGSFFRKSLMVLVSKMFGKKTILHIHGGEFKIFYSQAGFLQKYIRFILNSVDALICLSDEWKDYFDGITGNKKTIVLNNPVIFPPEVIQKKASVPVTILYLNHINKAKGIYDVLQCINENRSLFQGHFKFVIAGAGENQLVENVIVDNNLQDIVQFLGWVEGTEKEELLKSCDVFILTSYNEGLPMSILEAMVYKKAIISTNVGGIPRIVRPGENGWLIAPGDINSLGSVFTNLKQNINILDIYGKRSFEIAADYSPESVKEKLGRIYEEVVAIKPTSDGVHKKENKHAETETY